MSVSVTDHKSSQLSGEFSVF